jgi:hypothetical protein
VSNGIPRSNPATIDTIKKARKGLNLPQVISSTSSKMLNKTISKVIYGKVDWLTPLSLDNSYLKIKEILIYVNILLKSLR